MGIVTDNVTVIFNQWYVVVTIESDVPVHGCAIGIDLGLERFLTVSDGSFQERPKFFKSMQHQLKLLQRSSARKQKGSHNWGQAQTNVARMHQRIANRRQDFHLKTAHKPNLPQLPCHCRQRVGCERT